MFYKVGGYPDRGIALLRRYANELIEKENEAAKQKAMEIYENHLMNQVFESSDNYLLNTEIPITYVRLQVENKDF